MQYIHSMCLCVDEKGKQRKRATLSRSHLPCNVALRGRAFIRCICGCGICRLKISLFQDVVMEGRNVVRLGMRSWLDKFFLLAQQPQTQGYGKCLGAFLGRWVTGRILAGGPGKLLQCSCVHHFISGVSSLAWISQEIRQRGRAASPWCTLTK